MGFMTEDYSKGKIKTTIYKEFNATTDGNYMFTPDPRARSTMVEIQAAGGGTGKGDPTQASDRCQLLTGGNGGNFYSVIFTEKLPPTPIPVIVGHRAIVPHQYEYGVHGNDGRGVMFGNTVIAGGKGARFFSGSSAALIGAGSSQTTSSIDWTGMGNYTELFNVTGQMPQSGFVPRTADHAFIKGGNGGNSFWGDGGYAYPVIYSGARSGYRSYGQSGDGYGFGASGWASGNPVAQSGGASGEGIVIITEYF